MEVTFGGHLLRAKKLRLLANDEVRLPGGLFDQHLEIVDAVPHLVDVAATVHRAASTSQLVNRYMRNLDEERSRRCSSQASVPSVPPREVKRRGDKVRIVFADQAHHDGIQVDALLVQVENG